MFGNSKQRYVLKMLHNSISVYHKTINEVSELLKLVYVLVVES